MGRFIAGFAIGWLWGAAILGWLTTTIPTLFV